MKTLARRVSVKKVILAVAIMATGLAGSEILTPRKHWSEKLGNPKYAEIIPKSFGDWQEIPGGATSVVNPVQEENLMRLYSETVARTYIHKPTGRLLMLSVAYGKDQSTDTQIHPPESCYGAQGFRVDEKRSYDMASPYGPIKLVQLRTRMGHQRKEPVTYFIRVGESIARGSKERNLARLQSAMSGYLIDGLLFRVSEISSNEDSFALQQNFIAELLSNVPAETRRALIGTMPGITGT